MGVASRPHLTLIFSQRPICLRVNLRVKFAAHELLGDIFKLQHMSASNGLGSQFGAGCRVMLRNGGDLEGMCTDRPGHTAIPSE